MGSDRKNAGRVLAFDYGTKRIGVAVGHAQLRTAQALTTLEYSGRKMLWSQVVELIEQWRPSLLVVGLPPAEQSGESGTAGQVRRFAASLQRKTALPVRLVDEHLSTVEARRRLRDMTPAGKRYRKKQRLLKDSLAAQLILETCFEDNSNMGTAIDIEAGIANLAQLIQDSRVDDPYLVGIHTGGVWVAQRLFQILGDRTPGLTPPGELDISFYRDDFSRIGLHPEVKASRLSASVEQRNVILIDDVLYSGRTIRAAMNEIFSYGRPQQVRLGVLLERQGRELPIQADYIGCDSAIAEHQHVKLVNCRGRLSAEFVCTR